MSTLLDLAIEKRFNNGDLPDVQAFFRCSGPDLMSALECLASYGGLLSRSDFGEMSKCAVETILGVPVSDEVTMCCMELIRFLSSTHVELHDSFKPVVELGDVRIVCNFLVKVPHKNRKTVLIAMYETFHELDTEASVVGILKEVFGKEALEALEKFEVKLTKREDTRRDSAYWHRRDIWDL